MAKGRIPGKGSASEESSQKEDSVSLTRTAGMDSLLRLNRRLSATSALRRGGPRDEKRVRKSCSQCKVEIPEAKNVGNRKRRQTENLIRGQAWHKEGREFPLVIKRGKRKKLIRGRRKEGSVACRCSILGQIERRLHWA